MNTSPTIRMGRFASLVGAGFLTASAMAQQSAPQEVTVIAERPTVHVVGAKMGASAQTEIIELRHRVSFADLDLVTVAGAKTLQTRVANAAKAACEELNKLYPLKERESTCAADAEKAAKAQVDAAIAAAGRKAK